MDVELEIHWRKRRPPQQTTNKALQLAESDISSSFRPSTDGMSGSELDKSSEGESHLKDELKNLELDKNRRELIGLSSQPEYKYETKIDKNNDCVDPKTRKIL